MMDYRAIAALYAVIETQNFEAAAAKLCITQSAISQRIKSLESYYGEPLLVRTQPYQPTARGEILLGHYKRVLQLEAALAIPETQVPQISIAISRDSLETWFMSVLIQLKTLMPMTLEVIADDQEITHEYLRKGLVSTCVSTSSKAMAGCKAELIGHLDYVLVASPAFKKQYFDHVKNIKDALLKAPAVIFDNKDNLHSRYLKHFFNIADSVANYHKLPSVEGFRQFALLGYAYALVPKIDIVSDLKSKKLVNLFPDKIWRMPLYLHTWSIETKIYKEFNGLIIKTAKRLLET